MHFHSAAALALQVALSPASASIDVIDSAASNFPPPNRHKLLCLRLAGRLEDWKTGKLANWFSHHVGHIWIAFRLLPIAGG